VVLLLDEKIRDEASLIPLSTNENRRLSRRKRIANERKNNTVEKVSEIWFLWLEDIMEDWGEGKEPAQLCDSSTLL